MTSSRGSPARLRPVPPRPVPPRSAGAMTASQSRRPDPPDPAATVVASRPYGTRRSPAAERSLRAGAQRRVRSRSDRHGERPGRNGQARPAQQHPGRERLGQRHRGGRGTGSHRDVGRCQQVAAASARLLRRAGQGEPGFLQGLPQAGVPAGTRRPPRPPSRACSAAPAGPRRSAAAAPARRPPRSYQRSPQAQPAGHDAAQDLVGAAAQREPGRVQDRLRQQPGHPGAFRIGLDP